MKKPSGAHFRKQKKMKKELARSLDALGEIPTYPKDQLDINEDLTSHAKYRESGYNIEKILVANFEKKRKSRDEIARIKNKYCASDYQNKKSMYLDISEKENISPRTAMKYMTDKRS